MPKFRKTVLKVGRYSVNDLNGGRKEEVFLPERLKKIADSYAQMKEAGINVPAPWWHNSNEAVPSKELLKDSKNNAGWWNDLFLDENGDLVGEVEVPLEEDAKKIGTTVKEVSPLIRKKFIDGNGRIWDDVVTHVAFVTHPVQAGQDDFKPVKTEDEVAIAMSCYLGLDTPPKTESKDSSKTPGNQGSQEYSSDNPTAGVYNIKEALQCLRGVGVDLPDDTTPENLIERILVACRAIQGKDAQEGDEDNPERNGVTEQPQPIAMSVQMSTDDKQISAYRTLAQKSVQQNYVTRIRNLVAEGKLTKQYAQEHLEPLVQGFQLSLDAEGIPQEGQLDFLLKHLEALPPANVSPPGAAQFFAPIMSASPITPAGASALSLFDEEPMPKGLAGEEIAQDGEGLDEAVKSQLSAAGYL